MREIGAILWREFLDQRQNRMLWPVYLLMPLVGAALPAILVAASAAALAQDGGSQLGAMLGGIRMMAGAAGIQLEEAAARMFLRVSAGYFLLLPLAVVSIAGAYAIVGEKQQRSLESVLATPVDTRVFLVGKLLAVLIPAVAISWISAILGAAVSVASFWLSHRLLVWPDIFYWLGVLVLGPLIGAITALVCMRVSARMQDPQAANQMTALVLMPALMIVFSLVGPYIVLHLPALLAACGVAGLAAVVLFYWVKRGFDREEILCRWR